MPKPQVTLVTTWWNPVLRPSSNIGYFVMQGESIAGDRHAWPAQMGDKYFVWAFGLVADVPAGQDTA